MTRDIIQYAISYCSIWSGFGFQHCHRGASNIAIPLDDHADECSDRPLSRRGDRFLHVCRLDEMSYHQMVGITTGR